jgi:Fic family protein
MIMETLTAAIETKKAELDRLRARAPGGTANFDHSQDLELTYTSNAIEGNTLTAVETTMVIEQGITVGGKPLKDHLEAIDHFAAIRYVRDLAREKTRLAEMDVRTLHRLVMLRSNPDIAGRYADQGRYILTESGRHSFQRRQWPHRAPSDEPGSDPWAISACRRTSAGQAGLHCGVATGTGGPGR